MSSRHADDWWKNLSEEEKHEAMTYMLEKEGKQKELDDIRSTLKEITKRILQLPSSPREFHPEALTEPYVTVSRHTARATH
jgi:hypothetical protein